MKRRQFRRPSGQRRYRRLFFVAAEGRNTEPSYFAILNDQQSTVHVKCLKGGKDSAPIYVLKRLDDYLKEERLKPTDEAWLVVDKNHWPDEQLHILYTWSTKKPNYGFAVSNPKFEYWLLLHFEDGDNVADSRDCSARLRRYLPDSDKSICTRNITSSMIDDAVRRARQRDNPSCSDWPRTTGTTMYKLVQNIRRPAN